MGFVVDPYASLSTRARSLVQIRRNAIASELYQLMYDGNEPPVPPRPKAGGAKDSRVASRKGGNLMNKLTPLLAKMSSQDRNLILFLAGKAARKRSKAKTQ